MDIYYSLANRSSNPPHQTSNFPSLPEEIDWSNRHLDSPPSTQKKTALLVGKTLALIGIAFGLIGLGVVLCTFPPAILLPAAFICGAVALTSLIATAILFNPLKHNPSTLRKLGKKAEQTIRTENLSYPEIMQKFPEKIWDPQWKQFDLNTLLAKDANSLSFQEFLDKHGDACCAILQEENREKLQSSFQEWAKQQDMGILEFQTLYPNFTRSPETNRSIVHRQWPQYLNGQQTLDVFLQKNGADCCKYLTPMEALIIYNMLKINNDLTKY